MPYWSDTSCEDEDKAIKLFHAYNHDMNQTILPTEEMEKPFRRICCATNFY